VAAEERIVASPENRGQPWDSLVLTQDVRAVNGGTAYMPSASGGVRGALPAPYDPPVAHADRLIGADKVEWFTITFRLQP
jgi:hypothetical protein